MDTQAAKALGREELQKALGDTKRFFPILWEEDELPSDFDLSKSPPEFLERFGWSAFKWFDRRVPSVDRNGASTYLDDGRRVVCRYYRREGQYLRQLDVSEGWSFRAEDEDGEKKGDEYDGDIPLLEVHPYGGFVCGALRQWVPVKNKGNPGFLIHDLERLPAWQQIIAGWPLKYRGKKLHREEILPGGYVHPLTNQGVFLNPDPIDVEWAWDSVMLSSLGACLSAFGLPFDRRTVLYTVWRILGGTEENAPLKIQPVRGGWVTSLVIAQYPSIDGAKTEVRVKPTFTEMVDAEDEKRECGETDPTRFINPQIFQSTCSVGNWFPAREWDSALASIKRSHREWISSIGVFPIWGNSKKGRSTKFHDEMFAKYPDLHDFIEEYMRESDIDEHGFVNGVRAVSDVKKDAAEAHQRAEERANR